MAIQIQDRDLVVVPQSTILIALNQQRFCFFEIFSGADSNLKVAVSVHGVLYLLASPGLLTCLIRQINL